MPKHDDHVGLYCLYESPRNAEPRERTCFRKRRLEHNGVNRSFFADEALTDAEATKALAQRLLGVWIRSRPDSLLEVSNP